MCGKSAWTQTCGQLPGRQRRTPHVWTAGSTLGCIRGDLLGVWLWGQGFSWCLYQSFSLCTLDKKCHQIVIHGNLKKRFQKSAGKLSTFTLVLRRQLMGPEAHVCVLCCDTNWVPPCCWWESVLWTFWVDPSVQYWLFSVSSSASPDQFPWTLNSSFSLSLVFPSAHFPAFPGDCTYWLCKKGVLTLGLRTCNWISDIGIHVKCPYLTYPLLHSK